MPLFVKNIEFGEVLRISAWRKIAIGTWRTAGDPSVYGVVDVDAEPALAEIERLRASTGARVTLSHFVGRVMANSIRLHPDINCVLRFGKLYPRKNVDLFFQVASDKKGADLSGTVVRNVDRMSIVDLARTLEERGTAIREKKDTSYTKFKNLAGSLPGFCSKWLIGFGGFIMYALNLWSPLLGAPRDSFGSMMITNVGSLGLEEAFAPLVPYSRVPILIAVGAVRECPVVKDGKIVIGKRMKLCVTFDHRVIDGVHAGRMAETVKMLFERPGEIS